MKLPTCKGSYRLQACIFAEKWIPLQAFFKVYENILRHIIKGSALVACLRIQNSTFTKRV